ncbi:hypothetical protein SDC9_46431 [bioreactor metagenome]|uniref:Transposase IS4-like domain-containing protein n=1 Tax=bioreactor metagenome TaxID=1076179 RepID=A0A644W9L7_9ZZZZ
MGPWLPCSRVSPSNEWHAHQHGPSRRRQWRKVHLAMDTATSDIRAVEFTSSREGDSPTLPALLDQIPEDEQIGSVTADGAYDTRRCHTAILEHEATAIIPIRRNGRLWREDCPAAVARNAILRDVREEGRAGWKRRNGYPVRSGAGGKDAVPEGLRRPHRRQRPGPPNRRNPHPRRTHQPLQCTRHRRRRPLRIETNGKGTSRLKSD